MANQFGEFLRAKRRERGLSLSGAALKAGVSKSTLSVWESGTHLPRLPELEATLDALAVPFAQRWQVLALVNAPRAANHLRAERQRRNPMLDEQIGSIPCGGELLRAMRLRRNWTLERTAAQLGVQISTISRWERGETWLDAERLTQLCRVLGVGADEQTALEQGRFSLAPSEEGAVSLDTLDYQFRRGLASLEMQTEAHPGMDLPFLRLEASLWGFARRQESARLLLAEVYAHHANYLRNFRRGTEGEQVGYRALEMVRGMSCRPAFVSLAVMAIAEGAIWKGQRANPARGILLLKQASVQETDPQYQSWLLRKTAFYLSLDNACDDALEVCRRAGEFSARSPHLAHPNLEIARCTAQIWLHANRPQEALSRMPDEEDVYAPGQMRDALFRVEALLQCGASHEAHDWLLRAATAVESLGMEHYRDQLNALSLRF